MIMVKFLYQQAFIQNKLIYSFARIHKQIINKNSIDQQPIIALKPIEPILPIQPIQPKIPKIQEQQSENPYSSQERLTKYLSRTGICSRRQAEKMIQQGIVQVDKKKVFVNVLINPNDNDIQIFSKQGQTVPMKQDTKIWIYNKPVGQICTHSDPSNRPSVYDYVKKILKHNLHIISVGRLDFNSEGLLILTNDGALARVLELPESNIEREYRVRVYGRFDEDKLRKIQTGATIAGIKYGPFWCEVENRQTRNTWLRIRMTTGKNREIRKIMQKCSLRVNRLIRTRYGSYLLGDLQPGQIVETEVDNQLKRKLYLSMRKELEQKQTEIKAQAQIKVGIESLDIEDKKINSKVISQKDHKLKQIK